MDYTLLETIDDWNKYFLDRLKSNGFKDSPDHWRTENGTYKFVHFSPNVDEIIRKGIINISGGGLIGVVYLTPIRADHSVHNLGEYIFTTEIPQSLNTKDVKCLVFELTEEQYFNSLHKGQFNYVFESDCFYDSSIEKGITEQASKALERMKILVDTDDKKLFLEECHDFFNDNFALKHIYFEAFNEYLYTRQDSKDSKRLALRGEIMAKHIKDYIFAVSPKIKTSFSTSHFISDSYQHIANLENNNLIFQRFNKEDFLDFMYYRLKFYFKELCKRDKSISGRILLKSSVKDDRQKIEQQGADFLHGRLKDVALYQYDTIPKGEVGLVPMQNTKAYFAEYTGNKIKLIKELEIKINGTITSGEQSVLRIKS